jgi:hypothetical protein
MAIDIRRCLKEDLDRLNVSGSDSPLNVSSFEYTYDFEDGGLEVADRIERSDNRR